MPAPSGPVEIELGGLNVNLGAAGNGEKGGRFDEAHAPFGDLLQNFYFVFHHKDKEYTLPTAKYQVIL